MEPHSNQDSGFLLSCFLLLLGILTAMVKERRKEERPDVCEGEGSSRGLAKFNCLCGCSSKTRAETRTCTMEL